MNKLLSIGFVSATLIISGCASSNSHTQLKKHFLTGFHYVYTDIPEPLEMDLSYLRNEFAYERPLYSSEKTLHNSILQKTTSPLELKPYHHRLWPLKEISNLRKTKAILHS